MLILRLPFVRNIVGFLDAIIGDFYRHDGFVHSASIAFFMLLSAAPLLLLTGAIFGYSIHVFSASDALFVEQTLESLGGIAHSFFPFLGKAVEKDLLSLVDKREELGVLGFLILLLSASQLFRAFELALDPIFRNLPIKEPEKAYLGLRGFLTSKAVFGGFVLAVASFLLCVHLLFHFLFDLLAQFLPHFASFFGDPQKGGTWASIMISTVVTSAMFSLIVRMSVRRKMNPFLLLFGGFLFYVAIYWAGRLYSIYIEWYLRQIGAIYGSLTAFYILVLWIFCLSALFLLCAEIVKSLELFWRKRRVL